MAADLNHLAQPSTSFQSLPYEIRCMIWEATFESRCISLMIETVKFTRDFKLPFRHISNVSRNNYKNASIQSGDYTSFLTCCDLESPIALSVCGESRMVALARYRRWRMFNKKTQSRTIMWYPKLDVVDFSDALQTALDVPIVKPFPIFEKQFPLEISEVKNVVVPSSMWGQGQHKNIDVIWPLIDFVSLENFLVLLDIKEEKIFAKNFNVGLSTVAEQSRNVAWTIPEDIDEHVERMREHYRRWGPEYMPLRKKPKVRILRERADIFGMFNYEEPPQLEP